jgi:putative methyltransferase (TIGR04325 family)
MADAADSKSAVRKGVRVRVPPPAHINLAHGGFHAMASSMKRVKRALKSVPLVQAALAKRDERRFSSPDSYGSHWGVFGSFEEAQRSSPKTRPLGFDVPEYADHHLDRMQKVLPYDYPILFWLRAAFAGGARRIFDLGGNVGVHYYGYQKYLTYPEGLAWTVCELPALIAKGKAIAAEKGAPHLAFTERLEDIDGYDVVLAAGVLQYIEFPSLSELVAKAKRKPKHVFVNKVPLYDGESFVTLQNVGLTSLPQHVYNRKEFVSAFVSLGYEVVDQWEVPGFTSMIPSRPEKSVTEYSGLYLKAT